MLRSSNEIAFSWKETVRTRQNPKKSVGFECSSHCAPGGHCEKLRELKPAIRPQGPSKNLLAVKKAVRYGQPCTAARLLLSNAHRNSFVSQPGIDRL